MNTPKVSFYMTVRNGEAYLHDAVESILGQDCDDWEAVIVDDGSTDRTPEYLESLAKRDPRFRIFLTSGISRGKALNFAASMCKAEIITNLDADDLAHPARVRLLQKVFDDNPSYALVFGASEIFFSDKLPRWDDGLIQDSHVFDANNQLGRMNVIGHSSMAMMKCRFFDVGQYDEARENLYDYDLWVRFIEKGCRIGRSNYVFGGKRIHSAQSYEKRNHTSYALDSCLIQWRAIKAMKSSRLKGVLVIILRMMWANIPSSFRMLVRRFVIADKVF